MSSNRHTYPLVNGRLKAPFLRTFEVRTIQPGPKHRLLREALPMTGDEIDLSGIEYNTVLVFNCYPDRQHFRRVIEKTETTVTLQAHVSEDAALEARRRKEAGSGTNFHIQMWSKKEFETAPLWAGDLRGLVPGWHGAEAM